MCVDVLCVCFMSVCARACVYDPVPRVVQLRKLKTDLDGCEMQLHNHVDKRFEDTHQQITRLTKLMQNIATTQAAEHHASKYHVVKNNI